MTSDRANGYFEAFINQHASRPSSDDAQLMAHLTRVIQRQLPGSQLRWAGSQRKGTAIVGSDLDMCVETPQPVTEAQRRELRVLVEKELGRPARIQSHALRLPAQPPSLKVDVAFTNAAFGSRPLPDLSEFQARPARQAAARAFKLWTRAGHLPRISGWALETIVVFRDEPPGAYRHLDLFLRVTDWLEHVTAQAVEGVLRPAAFPRWDNAWSPGVAGRLEALRNHARALGRRQPQPDSWRSASDVGLWLLG